ncbi:MAG: TonB family protein [Pseudomonadota bacterium]
MFANPIIRILIGAPAAAAITYGLFIAMNALISTPWVKPEEKKQRVIERITPAQEDTEIRRSSRAKPRQPQSADRPPPPPKLSTSKQDINLPTPNIEGAPPGELRIERMSSLALNPVAISDRDAQPIRPPLPTYPTRAQERGLEGSCDVRFDVDVRGKPYNINADCTDSIFKREAERAVSRVEFAPKIVRGQAAERRNVVYPLEFQMADGGGRRR